MQVNPSIFREYDIRGLVDRDLTPAVAEAIGRAFGTLVQDRGPQRVVVGRDIRPSSDPFSHALIGGIRATGCDVLDVGMVPTPVLYFSIAHYDRGGGVMITGSHNPREFNGFKLCKGLYSLYGDSIQQMRAMIEGDEYLEGAGHIQRADPVEAYIDAVKVRINLGRPLRLVIDAGNGTGGHIAERVFTELGCEVIGMNMEPDGNFPAHLPDPTVPEYVVDLQAKVREVGADVGIGYDGDADRLGAIADNGDIVWGDKLLALYAREVLDKGPAPIVFDVKCSQGLVEEIEKLGGEPVMWNTGHSLIKEKMRRIDSPLAGEMSGHMFFADDYFGFDDGIFASLRLVQILSHTHRRLSELALELWSYTATPEIRTACPDEAKFDIVEKVRERFSADHEVIDVDGARILFDGGWALVRASNTQPIIVSRFEAASPRRLSEIREEVTSFLRSFPEVGEEGGH